MLRLFHIPQLHPRYSDIPKVMAAAAIKASQFPLFSSLARELRDQIWRGALPGEIGPALYSYRRKYWCPVRLSRSDEGYDPEDDENNLIFEFRHDLLDDIQFELPLAFVNHEARDITLTWVREQGIKTRPDKDKRHLVFVRPFDPIRDALFIPPTRWEDFITEPDDRRFQPDLLERLVAVKSDLTRIAVPESLLRSEADSLSEMFQYFFNLKVLYIVVDEKPDLKSSEIIKEHRWWEFKNTRGGALSWNNDRGSFDLGNSKDVGHENLYRLIEEVNERLGEGLVKNNIRSFELRPIYAIQCCY